MSEVRKLNPKQKLFCEMYVSQEFFGNGTLSYIEAYQPDQSKKNWYNTARSSASQVLTSINVCNYINELLDEAGLNDQFADKQLLFLMTQHSELSTKLNAVKEYNKVKGRIIDKIEPVGDSSNILIIKHAPDSNNTDG